MNFFLKHKTKFNIAIIVSIILDVIIGFIINKISSDEFDITAPHNIVLLLILAVLIVALIVCKIIESSNSTRAKTKRLQKAFQDNGGYEAVVDEMKNCIKKHDLKSMKELKKMVDIIER